MPHYCDLAPNHPLHGPYHDMEYGFPSQDEHVLFERLVMEIMQAGLSWELILKKRAALCAAFCDYNLDKIARFGAADIEHLLENKDIIRNRRKIEAVVANAGIVIAMRATGGFAAWLAAQSEALGPQSSDPALLPSWVKIFRKTFHFTGPEVVKEFLMSLSLLDGAHRDSCPVFARILKKKGKRPCPKKR